MALKFLKDSDFTGDVNIGTASATSSSKVTIQAQGSNGSDETALVLRNYSAAPYTGYVTQEFEVGTINMAEISGRRIDINNGEIIFRNKKSGAISDSMVIDSSGNVGIGTTSPSSYTYGSNLAIVDTGSVGITIQSNTTGASAIQFADGVSGAAQFRGGIDYYHSANSSGAAYYSRMDFRTNGATRITILGSGNVGIGTTSPDNKLEVQGVISSADAGLQKATFSNVGNDLVLTANADATNVTANILFKSSGAGGGAVSEKMRINSIGNVGIGTTGRIMSGYDANSKTLTVYDDSGGAQSGYLELAALANNNGYNAGAIVFINNANSNNTAPSNANSKTVAQIRAETVTSDNNAGDDAGSDLSLFTKPEGGGLQPRMLIRSDGNVGIGVTGPGAKLDVLQEARISYANANQYTLRITNTDGNPRILADGSAAHLIFGTTPSGSATATERMRIDNGGSVIIGDGATSGTPTADYRSLEIGRQGNTITGAPWKSNLYFSTNATVTAGSTAFTYRYASELPTQMTMEDGVFTWSNAVAGTVGNTISFTERMRIDSSGKMTIPAIANGIKFEITSSLGSNNSIIEMGQVGSDGFLDVSAAGGGIVSHLSGYTGYASYFLSPVGIGTTDGTGGFNVNSTTAGSYYNMSNVDSGNYKYTNPGGRLLTSNATGWFADGRDPILTLSSSGNSENSAIGNSIGLNLYTNSYTYNNFSPLITFSALSDSGSYASAYAAIAGRKTNRGPDTNWNTGDLCFWTTGPEASNPASYMQQAPTMVIKSGGNVGINENSPDAKLHVMGTTGLPATSGTAFTGTMRLGVSGGYGTVMDFGAVGPSTGTQWIQVTDASNQAIQYPLLLQPNGGDVGIGTASPNRKLHVAGKAIVGQTANYSSNAGMMHVYGDNSENSGILDIASNGNGRYYTRVCWNKTSTSQAGYWHIKTNVPIGGNVMFMAKFYGYIYGSAQVLDLTHAGYAYSGTNTVINQGVQNNGNNVNSSSAYYTSAGGSKLCFRVAFGTGATFSTYFAGVFMDMAFPSPAGAAFDFEIEAQSFSQNTTVY